MRLIIDGHLDLAMNALSLNRDITRDIQAARAAESGLEDDPCRGRVTVTLPEMRRAGVAVCIGTLIARSGPRPPKKPPLARKDLDYGSQPIAHAVARGQVAYYELLERMGEVRILRTRKDLDEHWVSWSAPQTSSRRPQASLPIGIILGMECADPIVDPSHLRDWWALGLRNIEPAHFGHSHYAGGTATSTGLTRKGVELLAAMQPLNMMLDLTHLSDESIDEVLDLYTGPMLASHSNCRALVEGQRQLPDHHIRRLVERGAVVGAALYNGMLRPGWQYPQTPRIPANPADRVQLEAVGLHIDHVCQLAGDSCHAAIGSDLDGGFGTEATPAGIDTIADLHKIAEPLDKRGYCAVDLDNIFHANWLRLFREALPP